MTIKIEFPAYDGDAAEAMGHALLKLAELRKQGATELTYNEQYSTPCTPEEVVKPFEDTVPEDVVSHEGTTPSADTNGVPFNPDFCAVAAEPFTKDGKWRRRRGVTEEAYNEWYRTCTAPVAAAVEPAPSVFAAAAFNPLPVAPAAMTVGGLMAWVSELQAVDKLTQADIDTSFSAAGVIFQDLVGPKGAEAIGLLHAELVKRVK
jgi:hypothetical protein